MIENLEYNLTSHADTMDGDSHPSSGNVMPEVTTDRHANTLRNKQPKGPTAVRMSTLSKDQTNLKQLLAQTNQASCVDKYFGRPDLQTVMFLRQSYSIPKGCGYKT